MISERYEITSPFRQVLFAFYFVGKTLNKLWLFAVFLPRKKTKTTKPILLNLFCNFHIAKLIKKQIYMKKI